MHALHVRYLVGDVLSSIVTVYLVEKSVLSCFEPKLQCECATTDR